jgi:hypothetical protein
VKKRLPDLYRCLFLPINQKPSNMNKAKGKHVPASEARQGIDAYRKQFAGTPYYRESISYTIAELRAFLDIAEKELIGMHITDSDDRCISFLPYINQGDHKLSVLMTPSVYKADSTASNGKHKHQFNKHIEESYGREGAKTDATPAPDPTNPYIGVTTPTDPYNSGQSQP